MRTLSIKTLFIILIIIADSSDRVWSFVVVPENNLAKQDSLLIVLCQTNLANLDINDHWSRELKESLNGFSEILAELGIRVDIQTWAEDKCPEQIMNGCYSKSGKIYCNEILLERIIFSLALMLQMTEQHVMRLSMLWKIVNPHEGMLDLLGRWPYTGLAALITIDYIYFSDWWDNYPFGWITLFPIEKEGENWVYAAKNLDKNPSLESWTYARDLVIWFIIGHESFHALREYPIMAPSFPEISGYLEKVIALQQYEVFCPSPPDNIEVNADICGLRWLEFLNERFKNNHRDTTDIKVARAAAMLTLSALFDLGLGALRIDELGWWKPTGYLYPFLRTAVVHRTLYNMNEGEPRLGLCNSTLNSIWESARKICVRNYDDGGSDVLLTPEWTSVYVFLVFPSVNHPASIPGFEENYCLDGTSKLRIPKATQRGDPSVSIRVLSLNPEANDQSIFLAQASAQEMINRPHIHAALSSCLPREVQTRLFRLRYTHAGELIGVEGEAPSDEKQCIKQALADLIFGESLHYAPREPNKPYKEPGWNMVIEIKRKK